MVMAADPAEAPLTLTVRQVAAQLQISRAQAYRMCSPGGVIPTIRVGQRQRVLRRELERLLTEGALDTTANGGSR